MGVLEIKIFQSLTKYVGKSKSGNCETTVKQNLTNPI